jgi:hypothetical protein
MTVLLIALLAFVAAMTMLGVSQAQMRSAARSQDRMMAAVLAESGIDDAIGQVSSDPTFAGRTGTIYEDPTTKLKAFGTFQTTITTLTGQKRKITSVGTNPNGSTSTVVAVITIDTRALGNAAIMSKGAVALGGTMDINSVPTPNLGISHVYANGNITMGGNSKVDGYLMGGGTVTGGDGSLGTESNVPPFPYPTVAETDKWKADWITASKATNQWSTNINQSRTITAPHYISGNITLSSSDTVVLNGPGIIYVDGNVKLSGQSVLTNGATLVVNGTFTQTAQTIYKMTTGMAQTPTMVVYGSGYGPTADVIDLVGGSTADQQGVVYAVNGSIKVAGGATFVGALVAGGTGASVKATGTYDHKFPENMSSLVKFPTAAAVEGVTEL